MHVCYSIFEHNVFTHSDAVSVTVKVNIVFMATGRMGLELILSVEVPVTIGIIEFFAIRRSDRNKM